MLDIYFMFCKYERSVNTKGKVTLHFLSTFKEISIIRKQWQYIVILKDHKISSSKLVSTEEKSTYTKTSVWGIEIYSKMLKMLSCRQWYENSFLVFIHTQNQSFSNLTTYTIGKM